MNRRWIPPAVAVALAVGFFAGRAVAEPRAVGPWKLVRDDDGVRVERRTIPGSNMAEFRGVGVVNAPLARVLAVLHDAPGRTEWMDRCIDSRLLDEAELSQITYSRTKAPWPVADRDVVVRVALAWDVTDHTVRIDFESVEDRRMPPIKGVVRMPFFRGHFYLKPTADRRGTEVEYQVHANPGGLLPDWIANRASREIPHNTLRALREQVKRRNYPDYEYALIQRADYQSVLQAQ
jgi:hypothetical protein